MNPMLAQPIDALGEFLAHALELEHESAERYRELAGSMAVHNNPRTAELFEQLARYGDSHAAEVRGRAAGIALPQMAPWDFKWTHPESPEAGCMEDAHYLMTPCQALELALHNEVRGRDFYAEVAASSPDPEVARLAREMASEEDEHVVMLREWIEREACHEHLPAEDLDPPHMPE